jgi:uncharacterized protein (DUF1501 family)
MPARQSGFLGQAFEPFSTGGDPAHADFQVQDVDFYPEIDEPRLHRRREFLHAFDRFQLETETSLTKQEADARASKSLNADSAFEQAFRMITSADAKQAFRLSDESAEMRSRYGSRTLGQSCLLARRLVERGVSFVTVQNTGWDTHDKITLSLRDGYSGAKVGVGLVPIFDQAFSALIEDLDSRGLLQETLVIAMGEFGRTPKLNARAGRDHWPRVFSVALAGGGIRVGQVIGSSDRTGESPLERPITPNDLACTIYTLLGIDCEQMLQTADGRPVPINQGGKFIGELG